MSAEQSMMSSDVKNGQTYCGGIAAAPLSKRQRVKSRAAGEDRISNMPRELITCILMCLPIHDLARTSILSKAWRNIWPSHPYLVLDSRFHTRLTSNKEENTHISEFIKAFNMILSSHTGPIQKFYLYISPVLRRSSIHQWIIQQLSDKGLTAMYFFFPRMGVYPLPPALFSCSELTLLTLYNCVVGPSIEAGSFTNLTKVQLTKASVPLDMTFGTQLQDLQLRGCVGIEHLSPQFTSGNNLRRLSIFTSTKIEWKWFQSTTKLEFLGLTLTAANSNVKEVSKLIKLLSKIPTFSCLEFDSPTLEVFGPPPSDLARPATKAVNLRSLTVYRLKIHNFCQILNVVYMIRSFPNLQDICIELALDQVKSLNPKEATIELYLASLDWKDMFLDRLQTVKMKGVVHSRYVLHFIKLLLASSPSLKVISLFCSTKITCPKEKLRIKQDLQQCHRLSLDAQIIWC